MSMTDAAVSHDWIPDTSTFGARLALVRWKMGWNLKEAATECNFSQNSWAQWEDGSMPRNFIEAVNRIVLRTRVNRVWLMTGEGSPEPERATSDYLSVGSRPIVQLRKYRTNGADVDGPVSPA